MSKKNVARKPKPVRNTLPWVQAAAFCEHIVEAKNGTWSGIGMFDQLTVGEIPPPPQPDMKPAVQLKILVSLKSGSVKGERKIKIVPIMPSGEEGMVVEASAVFNGDEHGVNIQTVMALELRGEGLYWFDVLVNGSVVTRMPLRILYSKPAAEAEQPAPPK